MSEGIEDPTAAALAAFDQAGANLRPIGEMTVGYYRNLIEFGAPTSLAQELSLQFHDRLMSQIFPPSNPLAGLFGFGQP